MTYLNFITLGNTLSDANNEANLILNCLDNCVSGSWRGDVKDSSFRLDLPDGLQTCSVAERIHMMKLLASLTLPKTGRPRCV